MHIPWHIPVPCRPTYVEEVLGFTYTDAPICLSYSCYGDLGKLNLSFGQAMYLFTFIPVFMIAPFFVSSKAILFILGTLAWSNTQFIDGVLALANKFLIHHSNHAGYALIVFYEISIHIHFLTSFNRFIAVFVPFSYKNMFSIRSTSLYLIVISVLSFTMMTVVIYGLGCELEYNPVTWVSFYDTTIPVCGFYAIYLDFMKNMIVVSADFIIDVVTILKVQKMRKKFREGKRSENYTKKEADFLKQTFGQGICYLMGYASYLMVPEMNSNKYVAFFMSLVSWDLIATIDGMFTIVYNAEIRNRIFKSSVTTAAGSTVVSIATDFSYKNKSVESNETNLPIQFQLEYFSNKNEKDYLEFQTEPKRIIPKNFLVRRIGNLSIPLNIPIFLEFLKRSTFRECARLNISRNLTEVRLEPGPSTLALARLRDDLVESGMYPFLNGGTFLGWYRECSIIPHTHDMDIGIFAEDYRPEFLEKLKKNHSDFVLSRQLGMINDSFELTVVPKSNTSIYIDLYSFYKEKDSEKRWVGGMGDSGEKFKFPYLPYDPWCSADLHGHLFWVACTPAKMVEAEYGKLWYEDRPTSEYLWNTQARPNGRWSERQMKEVYKVYVYDP
ncbi:hypothetical protein L3Y34_008666 [Caenorhabditis briggsae]|uniref:Uncharacterized protein n=1 Tax=Caenorhabditis briggsae TaxID=6238 RepID=A0AAE9A5E1_CAEBR|nr:hypothetical protein L3Y34_008666 [Caenorhabditis briggsae]